MPVPMSMTDTPGARRRPVRVAGDAHDAGEGLDQRVVAGVAGQRPGLAEGADGAVHQARIGRLQVVVAEAARFQAAGPHRMHQHVDLVGQPAHHVDAPAGVAMSMPTLRLLRFTARKAVPMPWLAGDSHLRASSPPTGRSTLITSAPKSPSSWVQNGPAMFCVRSRTVMPLRMSVMCGMSLWAIVETRGVAVSKSIQAEPLPSNPVHARAGCSDASWGQNHHVPPRSTRNQAGGA